MLAILNQWDLMLDEWAQKPELSRHDFYEVYYERKLPCLKTMLNGEFQRDLAEYIPLTASLSTFNPNLTIGTQSALLLILDGIQIKEQQLKDRFKLSDYTAIVMTLYHYSLPGKTIDHFKKILHSSKSRLYNSLPSELIMMGFNAIYWHHHLNQFSGNLAISALMLFGNPYSVGKIMVHHTVPTLLPSLASRQPKSAVFLLRNSKKITWLLTTLLSIAQLALNSEPSLRSIILTIGLTLSISIIESIFEERRTSPLLQEFFMLLFQSAWNSLSSAFSWSRDSEKNSEHLDWAKAELGDTCDTQMRRHHRSLMLMYHSDKIPHSTTTELHPKAVALNQVKNELCNSR